MPTFYRGTAWFSRTVLNAYCGVEVIGKENVPESGRLLVAPNHSSYLDPILVGSYLGRELSFMARRNLFRNPLFALLIRNLNAFAVDRDSEDQAAGNLAKTLETIGEKLAEEKAVLVFPEGTRSHDGKLLEIKAGVGRIAAKYQSPVLPVYVWGAFQCWPRGQKWPGRHSMKIFIDKPIAVQPCKSKKELRQERQRLTAAIAHSLTKLEQIAEESVSPQKAII